MKKTQFVEILRMIGSTKAFCITLVVVTALGIIAYAGISFATDSLKKSCETYYDEYNFYDLQLGSAYGFSDDTVEKLKENEHVNDAEAVYYTQELVTIGQDDYVAEISTSSGNLNRSRLVSGRLPQKDGECAAEQALLDRFGLKVGDTIGLSGSSDQLNSTEYTIVGAVELVTVFATNDFYNRGTSNLGDGQVTTKIMVDDSAFSEAAVRQLCYVTVNNRGQRGSDEYFSYVHSVSDELMPIVEDADQQEYDDQYSDYQQRIINAGGSLEMAEEKLQDMQPSQTFSSDINANPSYYYYTQSTKGTEAIVATLCTLLLVIAILVCFTTINRIVTEQHRIIGTQKAMGFLPREIYGKYIIYVAICTICGIVLGVAFAYFIMEKLVYQVVYGSAFIFQDFTPIINWKDTALIAAAELAAMCLSAFIACRSMLKKSAISLLNSNIRDNKGLEKTKKSRLPLRVSMVLRNLRSNPQILVTILVSVMGCTILMISVFTVHHGMSGISPRQFSELQHYQGTLTLNKDAEESELEEMKDFLEDVDTVQLLPVMEKFVSYKVNDSTQYATLIGIDSSEDSSPFLKILDADTLKKMEIPDKGVLICKKMAENYGYSVGDTFTLMDSMGGEHETFVAGVFDRNIGMAVIISPSYYAEVMDTDTEICQYYVMGSADDISQLCDEARNYEAYCNYSDSGYYEAEMEFKVSCLNKVILVVVVITGLLSIFVLFNLAQMNIRKKEKEIVVMKVLGLPPDRIRGYVFWEAIIMCSIGLIFGIIIGGPLGSYLTMAVEISNLQDIRGISFTSCILGGAINLAFYTLTNLFSLIGIRKIKMTGSAREA